MIEVVVGPEGSGLRFDKAIADAAGVSRSAARALVEAGEATLNGERATPRATVAAGDVLRFPEPSARRDIDADPSVPFAVVEEHPDYLVVDKPPGVVVHPGVGAEKGTLVAGLLARYPEIRGVGRPGRWGIVHRLDRPTSGAMLVARTEAGYEAISAMIKRREVRRTYLALIAGSPVAATGTVDAPIRRDPSRPTRMIVDHEGKVARTHYRVIERLGPVSLVEVTLETGRTHQIRVHMASIGHPVVGDTRYGRRDPVPVPRLFLHAAGLAFRDPFSGADVDVSVPLPDDLASVLAGRRV